MVVQKFTAEQARLYQERDKALDELSYLRQELQGEVDMEPDEADAQITEHETAAILIAIIEQKLNDIDAALVSIELGQYAMCERCGQPIESGRLAAKPDARFCISCQQVVENCRSKASPKHDSDELDPIYFSFPSVTYTM